MAQCFRVFVFSYCQFDDALAVSANHLLEHDIKNVFNQLDVDQNGFLGAPDLVKCFRR